MRLPGVNPDRLVARGDRRVAVYAPRSVLIRYLSTESLGVYKDVTRAVESLPRRGRVHDGREPPRHLKTPPRQSPRVRTLWGAATNSAPAPVATRHSLRPMPSQSASGTRRRPASPEGRAGVAHLGREAKGRAQGADRYPQLPPIAPTAILRHNRTPAADRPIREPAQQRPPCPRHFCTAQEGHLFPGRQGVTTRTANPSNTRLHELGFNPKTLR